jgi:hypothetical protein
MRITLCARSKILTILKPGSCFRIQVTGSLLAGSHVDLIPNSEPGPGDSTIYNVPKIVADMASATQLAHQTIDFDYGSEEFIISNRGNEG